MSASNVWVQSLAQAGQPVSKASKMLYGIGDDDLDGLTVPGSLLAAPPAAPPSKRLKREDLSPHIGLNWTLTGQLISTSTTGPVKITRVASANEEEKQLVLACLGTKLSLAKFLTRSSNSFPRIAALSRKGATQLLEKMVSGKSRLTLQAGSSSVASYWDLLELLDDLEEEIVGREAGNGITASGNQPQPQPQPQRAKRALLNWLAASVGPEIAERLSQPNLTPADRALLHIAALQMNSASEAALQAGNTDLAVLIQYLESSTYGAAAPPGRLHAWAQQLQAAASRSGSEVPLNVRRLLALFAGSVELSDKSCRWTELGWKAVLGLKLRFTAAGRSAPLAELVAGLLSELRQEGNNHRAPLDIVGRARTHAEMDDTCLLVLSLFSGTSGTGGANGASGALTVAELTAKWRHAPNPGTLVGVFSQWLTYHLVRAALEDSAVDGAAAAAFDAVGRRLSESLYFVLLGNGMWAEAVFVALHVSDGRVAEKLVRDAVARFASVGLKAGAQVREAVASITRSLRLPEPVVTEAVAHYFRYCEDFPACFDMYAEAGNFTAANHVLIHELGPRLVVQDTPEAVAQLRSRVAQFRSPGSAHVHDGLWAVGGEAFGNYAKLQEFRSPQRTVQQQTVREVVEEMDSLLYACSISLRRLERFNRASVVKSRYESAGLTIMKAHLVDGMLELLRLARLYASELHGLEFKTRVADLLQLEVSPNELRKRLLTLGCEYLYESLQIV